MTVFVIHEIDPLKANPIDHRKTPPVTCTDRCNSNKSPRREFRSVDTQQVISVLIDRNDRQQVKEKELSRPVASHKFLILSWKSNLKLLFHSHQIDVGSRPRVEELKSFRKGSPCTFCANRG